MSIVGRAAVGVALASGVLSVAGVGSAGAAGNLYGTLAVSPGTGKVVEAVDHPSRVAADAAAIRDCGVYDCRIEVRFVNGCAAIARGADGQFAGEAAGSREEAERLAVAKLGESAPPFPDLGSASPRAASIVLSSCTKNAS
ncbi:uncharacterized protein DUF4189 [Nocardia tenerifensis]|uniref:Uncharacterized protein DUF4189 n=1 Tax=Nocardia tenerifensis TaxID=228006 RepID=A0A318JLQ1_9NOCA|nr:DUF4189 domain-containing protein [Nocardia tenerifensis]PXX53288.1 uncharacterized protein DUF4189 [Nocardia tenerifensis]